VLHQQTPTNATKCEEGNEAANAMGQSPKNIPSNVVTPDQAAELNSTLAGT